MKQIKKQFNTLKQAENYLFKLYSKYNKATCISQPPNSEKGIYTFLVGA